MGLSPCPSPEAVKKVEYRLWTCLQFTGPVYIGMRNIRPKSCLRDAGAINTGHLPELVASKITADLAHTKMKQHDLWFDAWAFPAPKEPGRDKTYETRVLNAFAFSKVGAMS
jgi:hypothetical protein